MKNWVTGLFVFFLVTSGLCSSVGAVGQYDGYQAETPQFHQSNGALKVFVRQNGDWEYQGSLAFDKFYRERELELQLGPDQADRIEIKLVRNGGGGAYLDAVRLGERFPAAVAPPVPSGLAKLAAKDFDVLQSGWRTIELVFDSPVSKALLGITARIEGQRLSEIPFQLPLSNLYRKMDPQADFWIYTLDSNRGSLESGRMIDVMGKQTPFFKEYLKAGSGHPSNYVYGWVMNDEDHLYVLMDLTGDNTLDGDKDYAKVYINTPDGLQSFKITASETRWGETRFIYTDHAGYQHKVYLFRIPYHAFGLDGPEEATELQLAFAAYGTLAPSTFSKAFAPDTIGPGSVSTLTFTIANDDPANPITDVAFVDTLPAGLTIAAPANAESTCDGTLSAPDGGTTIELSGGEVGAGSTCTVSIDVTSDAVGIYQNVSGDLTSSAGNSGAASADLTVAANRPGFAKSFSPASIPFGGRSTLTFTIDNSLNTTLADFLSFFDILPAGMVIASPANVTNTCVVDPYTGGVVTAVPGTGLVSLESGGGVNRAAVDATSTCSVSVDVIASAAGEWVNSSGSLATSAGTSGKANAALEVTVTPILLIKSFGDDPQPPGGNVTLEFTVLNRDRNFSATDITFTDDLDAALSGLTAVSTPLNDACGAGSSLTGSSELTLTGGNLAPGASCTFSVALEIPLEASPGIYPNSTSVISANVDGSPVLGNTASDNLFVYAAPIFTKEFIDDPTTGGGTVTLRFTITNTDPASALTGIAFTDDIGGSPPPDGRAGALAGLAANGLVAAGGLDPEPVVDPCGAGSLLTIPDPNDTLPSPPFPNLPPDPTLLVFTGGSLTPAGTQGDSCTFDVVLDVPAGPQSGAYLNTTSPLTAMPTGASPASDSLIVAAAPQLTKEFTDDPVAPGGTVTLEFTLSHPPEATGNVTDISFTDDLGDVITGLEAVGLPANDVCGAGSQLTGTSLLTLTGGQLTPGESCTFDVTLRVPAAAAAGSHANITSEVNASVQGMNVTGIGASSDLEISSLMLTKEFTDDPVIPGDTTTLEFTIQNLNPIENATGIIFTDDLSEVLSGLQSISGTQADICGVGSQIAGTSLLTFLGGSLPAGGSCTFSVTLAVPASAASTVYPNITSAVSAMFGVDSVTADPATDQLTINADLLSLTKEFIDDPVRPGDPVTLRFRLENLDASRAVAGISFTDDLDAGLSGLAATGLPTSACGGTLSGAGVLTFSGGSLGPGASCNFDVSLNTPAGAFSGAYTNTTSAVTGTIGGLEVGGNPASDTLRLHSLNFTKSFDGPTTATGGALLSFTIENLDESEQMTDIAFSDDLDAVLPGLTAVGLPAADVCGTGSQLSGTSFLTLTGANLGPGASCSFNVTLLVPAGATSGSFLNTTSDLLSNGLAVADPASATLTVEPAPVFGKSFAPDTVIEGQSVTLTFTIDNSASVLAATNLSFTDNLPAGVEVASLSNAASTCGGTLSAVPGAGAIELSGGSIAAGASCTLQVDVVGTQPGTHLNTTGSLTSSSGSSGTATDTLIVNPRAPNFGKSFASESVVLGQTSTLTFTIDNTAGGASADSLAFTDNLPVGLEVADPPNAGTTCIGGILTAAAQSGSISYSGGSVGPGSVCTVQVDVQAADLGEHVNTTGDLTSSSGNSGPATASINVFVSAVAIPTLNQWGLAGIAVLLLLTALWRLRTRRDGKI